MDESGGVRAESVDWVRLRDTFRSRNGGLTRRPEPAVGPLVEGRQERDELGRGRERRALAGGDHRRRSRRDGVESLARERHDLREGGVSVSEAVIEDGRGYDTHAVVVGQLQAP